MADPVTIAALGATVAGGILQAGGAKYQSEAQANMYTYQGAVARLNAQIADQNADWERHVGEVQAQQAGMKTRQTVGLERASYGAGNIDVNTGSAAKVQESELAVGQENQAVIRSNAAHRAYAAEVQGRQDTAQAQLDEYAATTSIKAGEIGEISSLIGTAGSVSTKWLQGRQIGLFGGGGSPSTFGAASSAAIY